MRFARNLALTGAGVSLLVGALPARADYDTHPELAPSVRCAGLEDRSSPTGYGLDCQPLVWDLPAATHVGETATAAPLASFPDFAGGRTDRPPPLYTDGGKGFERPGAGRTALCASPSEVPYWKDTNAKDANGAEVYEVACRRGTRAYYGPWTVGTDPLVFDKLAYKVLVFDNASRLAAESSGSEMNVSAEVYDHVASHHGTCYVSSDRCADATNPDYANSTACDAFRQIARACPAEGPSTDCPQQQAYGFVAFRSTTGRQGRYTMDLPPGRAFPVARDPMWLCQQHVVAAEPTVDGRPRDFRKQRNGAVGEMVIQLFTEPASNRAYKPVDMGFDFVASAATTLIPPHTIAPQDTVWYAPFDLAIGMITIHSHANMVKGTVDVVPASPPRLMSSDPRCGGPPSPHVYENYDYFQPQVCEYWRDAEGPLVLRKGEAIHASCLINNGVRPTEAIADPTLRRAVETSAAGHEVLYGDQAAASYRSRYGCEKTMGVPPGRPGEHARDCPPNPDGGGGVDRPYDASGANGGLAYCPTNLGYTGRCVPANAVFSNTGPDSMCIPIVMYWPLDRVLGADGSVDPQAAGELRNGNLNQVGTPGRVWKSPSDGGACDDGAGSSGPSIADPNPLPATRSSRCRAGL